MIRTADTLYRLVRSPRTALWAGRGSGAATAMLLAHLLVLATGEAQLPMDDALPPVVLLPEARAPLASLHLFGAPGDSGGIVATALALTLRGIIAGTAPGFGTAVIAGEGQVEAGYHVGDKLPGGGVLASIHTGHVVIRNNGRREMLALASERDAVPGPADPASQASASVALLAEGANVLPAVENGRTVGARVAVADVGLLERVGLRRDDIVVSIDGQPADSQALDRALREGMRAGGGASLVVRRDGREQTVRVGH